MRSFIDRQDQYFALLKRTDKVNCRLAVFVHGFGGTYLTTWGDLASCLDENADSESPFADWDYLFFGYDTPTAPSLLSVSRRLAGCIKDAASGNEPYGYPYERFALFGHSLGTLAIRQLLCATIDNPPGFAASLHSVVLFASPVDGSWLARIAKLSALKDLMSQPRALFPNSYKLADSLRPKGSLIDMLRTWYETIRSHVDYPQALVVQSSDDLVLGYDTAFRWHEDERLEVPAGHTAMTKVCIGDWRSSFLRDRLAGALR